MTGESEVWIRKIEMKWYSDPSLWSLKSWLWRRPTLRLSIFKSEIKNLNQKWFQLVFTASRSFKIFTQTFIREYFRLQDCIKHWSLSLWPKKCFFSFLFLACHSTSLIIIFLAGTQRSVWERSCFATVASTVPGLTVNLQVTFAKTKLWWLLIYFCG